MKEKTSKTAAEFGAEGGKARAQNLTRVERTALARKAALARWGTKPVLRATHSGELKLGNVVIPCAVLEDGTRVLTQRGFYEAIGRSGRPEAGRGSKVDKVAPFLALNNLKPFVSNELARSSKPIMFHPPNRALAFGYRADLLPKVCEVYLQARDAGALRKSQEHFAVECDILMRGLAHVGIIALVDEASGFQDARARDALAKILEAFVAKEIRKWVRMFPVEYYKELCRLRGIAFSSGGPIKLPSYIGHLTNDLVYSRLAPGVLTELRRKNPVVAKGRRKHKHFQWLTDDIGDPALKQHLWNLITLMKAANSWEDFYPMVQRALPAYSKLPLLAASEQSESISGSSAP